MSWNSVTNRSYRISLLSVLPGTEFAIIDSFEEDLRDLRTKGHIGEYRIFKVFGSYDLLLLYETKRFGVDLVDQGVVPGIIHHTEVIAFEWCEGSRASFDISWFGQSPVIGLSFYKFKPRLSRLEIEELFVDYSMSMAMPQSVMYLGSVGWAEALIVFRGDTIPIVFQAIHKFGATWFIGNNKAPPILFPLKSFSMLGLRSDLLRDRAALDSSLDTSFHGTLYTQMFVSCRPEDIRGVARTAARTFRTEKVDVSLGSTDICVDLEEAKFRTWAEFVHALISFRTRNHTRLLGTSVQFQALAKSVPLALTQTRQERRPSPVLLLKPKDLRRIGALDQGRKETVLRSFYAFNSLLQNELLRDSCADLVPFMQYLLHEIRSGLSAEWLGDFERRMDRLRVGAEQRTLGAGAALLGGEGRFSPFRGGIQRLLLGAACLPNEVFQIVMGFRWPGFVLVGADKRYWHVGGTVNLPLEAAFRPSCWWGLTHETGHVMLELSKTWLDFDEFVPEIETRLGKQKGSYAFGLEVDTISEVFLDMFDCEVFFRDWLIYLKTIWKYLGSESSTDKQLVEHLAIYGLRSFCVYVSQDTRDLQALKFGTVKVRLRNFLDDLNAVCESVAPTLATEIRNVAFGERVLETFSQYKGFFRRLWPAVDSARRSYARFRRSRRRGTEAALRKVLAGQVFEGAFSASDLVHSLNRRTVESGQALDWQVEIAALLSLWGQYQKHYALDLVGPQASFPRSMRKPR